MSVEVKEIIKWSSRCVSCVVRLKDEDVKSKFRTRARQLFEVLVYQGLPYVLAYAISKAKEQYVKRVYELLCTESEDYEAKAKAVEEAMGSLSAEDKSYCLYAASLLCVISRTLKDDLLKKDLDKVIYEDGFDRKTEAIGVETAKWIKLFAEAKIEKEER